MAHLFRFVLWLLCLTEGSVTLDVLSISNLSGALHIGLLNIDSENKFIQGTLDIKFVFQSQKKDN